MHKLRILICEHYQQEIEHLLHLQEFQHLTYTTFPPRCGHPPLSWDEVIPNGSDKESEQEMACIIGGQCVYRLQQSCDSYPSFRIETQENCFSFLVNQTFVEYFIQQGNYLLTPGWLARWKDHLEEWGFDHSTASTFFHEFARQFLLLDTGIDPHAEEHLRKMADALKFPYTRIPVGLEMLHVTLRDINQAWQAEQQHAHTIQELSASNKRLADYAMLSILLSKISAISAEQAVITDILDLFTTLCAPLSYGLSPDD